jgi:cytochrome b involved in lipid metabolism
MSKIVIVAVFIFWIAVSFFYANTLVEQNLGGKNVAANINTNTSANSDSNVPSPISYTLTTALVAQHNTAADCWATVGNNVYNVTSYIRAHPGGASNITSYCGADIGAAFASQGHSANASNIMASYKIGILGTVVDSTAIEAVNNNPIANTGGRGDDDDDDD